jgi:hypothetical protein
MGRIPILIATGYAAWVVVCVLITVLKIGDAGANAHLALIFTGLPSALLSLIIPNGTLLAVLVAGTLGLIQWVAVAELISRWLAQRGASRGA